MEKKTVGIVSVLPSNYSDTITAFGQDNEGEQVFISPNLLRQYDPQVGDTVEVVVVLNHPDKRDRTKYRAVSVRFISGLDSSIENIVPIKKEPPLSERILDVVEDWQDDHGCPMPITSRQICEELGSRGVDTAIRDELEKLHKVGSVVKASIYSKENQKRVSLTLWAASLDAFTWGIEKEELDEALEVHG
jgi:hypothetical protein